MSLTRKDVIQLLYPNLPLDEVSANDKSNGTNGTDSRVKASKSRKASKGKNSSSSGKRGKVVYSSDESGCEQDFEEGNSDNDSVGGLDVDTLLYESITANTCGARQSKGDSDYSSEEDTEPQCVDNTLCAAVDSANDADVRMNREDVVVKEITDSVLLRTMKQLGTEVKCQRMYFLWHNFL